MAIIIAASNLRYSQSDQTSLLVNIMAKLFTVVKKLGDFYNNLLLNKKYFLYGKNMTGKTMDECLETTDFNRHNILGFLYQWV